MTCEGVKLELFSLMTGQLNEQEVQQMRAHLSTCSDCRAEYQALEGVWNGLSTVEMVEVARKYGCPLMVDDAHAMGVLGPAGAGTAEYFGVEAEVDLIMGTFSKSFASIGGFIAGEAAVIDYLKHHARSLIFSASMPPSAVATVYAALELIKSKPERRERLWRNARKMQEGIRSLGYDIGKAETPIVPIIVGDDTKTFLFWKCLLDAGVFTNPVVSPAVPPAGRASAPAIRQPTRRSSSTLFWRHLPKLAESWG